MNICVYCSSHDDIDPRYKELAREVGEKIARDGDTLVFGGIRRGLMRIVAEATQKGGGRVVGVIPKSRRDLADATHAELNDENIYTDGVNLRKDTMIRLSERFIVLPGGYGTLDEIMSTLTQILFEGLENKEIILYNIDHLWDPLLRQFQIMRERGLLSAAIEEKITVFS